MLGNIIGGFIVILVGVTLAPTVADQIAGAQDPDSNTSTTDNVTGAADTIIGLSTLFYCLAVATSAIGLAVTGLRKAGLM